MMMWKYPLWGRGFRPFFLMAAVYAVATVLLWVGMLSGFIMMPALFDDPLAWHGHEMVYGYTMAVIAGFLLTAVANWTGGAPARGKVLAGLCLIWLLGRLGMNGFLPISLAMIADLAFIPALGTTLGLALFRSRNTRNFVFLAMLAFLWGCDAWLLLTEDREALYLALLVVAAMISLVGGRIIPAFTVAALRRRGIMAAVKDQPILDVVALSGIVLLGIMWLIYGVDHFVYGLVAAVVAALHLWRWWAWYHHGLWRDPMLWILHVGYLWLTAGFGMLAVASAWPTVPISIALHLQTVGGIGSMTIGMLVRVTLGHTGRDLCAGKAGVVAFLLMQAAILTRVFLPLYAQDYILQCFQLSAILWAGSFVAYLLSFGPYLLRHRPDGAAP